MNSSGPCPIYGLKIALKNTCPIIHSNHSFYDCTEKRNKGENIFFSQKHEYFFHYFNKNEDIG